MPSADYRNPRRITGIKGKNFSSPFDDLAPEYDAWFDKDGSLVFSIETRAFKTLLPALPKPWLEVGIGSGRFAQALGIETGIDPSINLVKMAKRRGINALQGRGEQKLFDEGTFGTVFLIVTLCFLDSPLDVLKEASRILTPLGKLVLGLVLKETSRILTPRGKLVLGLVLKESPWGQFYQAKKAQGHRFYKFANFYSFDDVVRLIEQAGFSTEKIISTLFQRPGEVQHAEVPREGYLPDAGFTIIVAGKRASAIEGMTRN